VGVLPRGVVGGVVIRGKGEGGIKINSSTETAAVVQLNGLDTQSLQKWQWKRRDLTAKQKEHCKKR